MNIKENYQQYVSRYASEVAALKRKNTGFITGELLAFGGILAFLICYFALDGDTQNYLMGAALCLITYLGIRRLDDKNKEKIEHLSALLKVYQDEIKAWEGDFSPFETGDSYQNPQHPYSFDLDVFGKSSLFNRICRTITSGGSEALARNLTRETPLSMEDIKRRRDLQKELAGEGENWRMEFLALGEKNRSLTANDKMENGKMKKIDSAAVVDAMQKVSKMEVPAWFGSPVSLVIGWLLIVGVIGSVILSICAEALRDPDLPDIVRRVLEIRTALGKTSVAKYSTMLVAHCQDHRLRGILQFYGANRSGRWAGRLVQTHNLAKNTLPDLALARKLAAEGDFETMGTLFGETAFVFSELIRTAFIPSEGCRFVVSDFSAIEARVLAWIAGEEWTLEAFRQGKDIYCETASMMYHVPVEKHGANSHLRQKGKVAVLACGYQGGVGAMKRMDKGGTIPEDELQSVVDQWRGANPSVVKLWRNCEMAARTVIEEHRTVRLKNGIAFGYVNGNLFIKLPSGRMPCRDSSTLWMRW